MRRVPWRVCAAIMVAVVIPAWTPVTVLAQQPSLTPEPEPFRGDDGEIDGRDFDYSEDAFLQRFSFRFRPEEERRWLEHREGARGTAGSVSSSEFLVYEEVRKAVTIEKPLYFSFRHYRTEDFDSRYDHTLLGAGLNFGQWDVAAFSEIFAEKALIDLQVEGTWRAAEGHRLRVATVLVDLVSDGKSDEFSYEKQPFTWFGDGTLQLPWGAVFESWVNSNTSLRREELTRGFDYTYWQNTAGASLTAPLTERWRVTARANGLLTERSRRVFDPMVAPVDTEQRFDRRHGAAELELEHVFPNHIETWVGLRYFRLSERDRRPAAPEMSVDLIRREWLLHFGVYLPFSKRFAFWPAVFLGHVDNLESMPFTTNPEDRDTGLVSKINLPLDIRFERGYLTINPTFTLTAAEFGGGNVQLMVPF